MMFGIRAKKRARKWAGLEEVGEEVSDDGVGDEVGE